MTAKEKQDAGTIFALIAIAVIIWWILHRKKSNTQNVATNPDFVLPPAAYWGSGNGPFSQGGTTPEAQMVYDQYNVPAPTFGYGGDSSVYMPLFGFVGYSDVGTYAGG